MSIFVIGCDPGLTGAISLIWDEVGLVDCVDLPTSPNGLSTGKMLRWVDVKELEKLLHAWSIKYDFAGYYVAAAIERPIPMPTLPAQTVASQFDTFGVIRALLQRRADETRVLNPKDWKGFYGLGTDKDASRACALRLYPSAPVTRVKDHNRAESILIGHWLMREVA